VIGHFGPLLITEGAASGKPINIPAQGLDRASRDAGQGDSWIQVVYSHRRRGSLAPRGGSGEFPPPEGPALAGPCLHGTGLDIYRYSDAKTVTISVGATVIGGPLVRRSHTAPRSATNRGA